MKLRLAALVVAACLVGCSHGAPRKTPELSAMEGKKVALLDVEGEETARKVVEVALINQLSQRGTFILVSKEDLEAAKASPAQDPTDWKGLAKRTGADYALRAKVLKFDATEKQGYSEETVEDSLIAQEQGAENSKTTHVYKVKSLTGQVQVQMEFTQLGNSETRSALAEAQDTVTEEGKTSAIHLPPRLRYLEKLANQAFAKFFDQYN